MASLLGNDITNKNRKRTRQGAGRSVRAEPGRSGAAAPRAGAGAAADDRGAAPRSAAR